MDLLNLKDDLKFLEESTLPKVKQILASTVLDRNAIMEILDGLEIKIVLSFPKKNKNKENNNEGITKITTDSCHNIGDNNPRDIPG